MPFAVLVAVVSKRVALSGGVAVKGSKKND